MLISVFFRFFLKDFQATSKCGGLHVLSSPRDCTLVLSFQ